MIREIKVTEIMDCVNVIRDSFQTVADEYGYTKESVPRFTAFETDETRVTWHMLGEHRPMFGYFEDDKLVGYYSLTPAENNECELRNLCVLPEYRHQQIGLELLKHSVSTAKELGCKRMKIGIMDENFILKSWYEIYGFIQTGTKKFDFFPFTVGYLTKML